MATYSGTVRGGSLNLRKSCSTSAAKLASIPDGTVLSVMPVSGNRDWMYTSYSGQAGYVLAPYIAVTSGESNCTVTISSGSLNVRQTPSVSSTKLYAAAKGAVLYVLDASSVSGWYQVSCSSGTGWAVSSYLTMDGSGSRASDDFTDVVNTTPTVTTYYTFSPDDAVAYAEAHSSNSIGVADPKRNTSFGEGASAACANFVHQCLIAGGARMFDGWCYKLSGIPSSWNSGSWTYTNKGRRRLLEKGWIYRVSNNDVRKGDMIYTYLTNYASKGLATPFQHVTIAVSDYDAEFGGCYVCGHTKNQNHKKRTLPVSGTTQAYCYRVRTSLGGDEKEKEIDLTDDNSRAI